MIVLWILLGLIVFVVFFLISIFNRLVWHRSQWKNNFSQIHIQLKRRYDLISSIVELIKINGPTQKETTDAVSKTRNTALTASKDLAGNLQNVSAMKQFMQAETNLGSSLDRLFTLIEGSQELRNLPNMKQLSDELTSIEDKILESRNAYNNSVAYYNFSLEAFPNNIIARMFDFEKAQIFDAE